MQRIQHATATVDNKFTEGNPTSGTPATVVTADWLNGVQEELIGVILAAGLTPASATNQLLAALRALTMPVGHIVHLYVDTNPAALYGFGTWAEIAQGRVLVGKNAADPVFDTIGETGGSKTHTLSESELPVIEPKLHVNIRSIDGTGAEGDATVLAGAAGVAGYIDSIGGGQPHNNLQPYLVCRIWRRTA